MSTSSRTHPTVARIAALAPLFALHAACTSASPVEPGAGGAGGSGNGIVLPDPGVYDCTAAGPPDRVTPIDPSCATDRTCPDKLVSGHRGAGGQLGVLAPEDTLASVRAAIAIGLDFVETDPRPTADGVLVNLHDTTVDRTTDGTGAAADLTLAELQALHIDAGAFPGDYACERIPTLADVLATARGKVHVLVDANKTDRVDLLVAAIQATDTLDWAIFDTSSTAKIEEALVLEPALHTMVRVGTSAELAAALALFAAHPPVIVELSDVPSPQALTDEVHAAGHRALIDVFAFDLLAKFSNDPSDYAPVFADGIDIAQTDRPELVLHYLGR
ncbi:MAG: glycerophosphodiester phosphodiesterase family protein [Polyangiaceae bacterium]|nr:glycerophosphodiester phosphodiesterase family protein [Polyangiaceae bacterium]